MPSESSDGPVERRRFAEHSDSNPAGSSQETKSPPPPLKASPDTQPCPEHPGITCSTSRDWIDKTTLGLEAFGLLVLIVYTVATMAIWCANKNAADAAKSAADTAHAALVKGNRPWVGVDGSPSLLEPLLIGNSVNAKIHFVLKNVGTSPALHVNVSAVVPAYETGGLDELQRVANAMCASADDSSKPLHGEAIGPYIFPADTIPRNIGSQSGPGIPKPVHAELSFNIIGCIAYLDQFQEAIHHTRLCFTNGLSIAETKPNQPLKPCAVNQEAD
jgi:hypothetical protein